MFCLVAQGCWPDWSLKNCLKNQVNYCNLSRWMGMNHGYIHGDSSLTSSISEKIWDLFGIFWNMILDVFGHSMGIYIYILYITKYPTVGLSEMGIQWNPTWQSLQWESNERGLRHVGGNRSALAVAESPSMVVRCLFFPWFSTDLICWKRISPPKKGLEHNLQSRIWV